MFRSCPSCVLALVCSFGTNLFAQELTAAPQTAYAAGRVAAGLAAARAAAAADCPREIENRLIVDPGTGATWRLRANPHYPAGPASLTLDTAERGRSACRTENPPALRIRAGDRVVIEEHTTAADVRFEAIALAPAGLGQIFAARRVPGDSIVRAVADAPGHGQLIVHAKGKR